MYVGRSSFSVRLWKTGVLWCGVHKIGGTDYGHLCYSLSKPVKGRANQMAKVKCEMRDTCKNPVTHIGEKGYVYCAAHAPDRRGFERVRKMRTWELRLLQRGEQVPSYKPITQREHLSAKREEYLAQQEDAQGVLDPLNYAQEYR